MNPKTLNPMTLARNSARTRLDGASAYMDYARETVLALDALGIDDPQTKLRAIDRLRSAALEWREALLAYQEAEDALAK